MGLGVSTATYTKGIGFAAAENALRFTAYNLRRAINMMGVEGLIEAMRACLSAASHQIYTVILKSFISAICKMSICTGCIRFREKNYLESIDEL